MRVFSPQSSEWGPSRMHHASMTSDQPVHEMQCSNEGQICGDCQTGRRCWIVDCHGGAEPRESSLGV